MSLTASIVKQWRRPTGRLGRLLALAMNRTHSPLTDWGLEHVSIGKRETILDVGCGGGGTVRKLAQLASEGTVYGIDFSKDSVEVARRTNKRLIEAGRVQILCASVSCLPSSDGMFDLVTAINHPLLLAGSEW
jgi:ubiquinone/menaquinone biosynthesis C-methylase UbiE